VAEQRSTAASSRPNQTHVAVLLAAAAITTALIGARTASLHGAAGGEWETGVRAEVRRGAAATTADISVFGSAVINVTHFQEAWIRAKEYLGELARRDDLRPGERTALEVLAVIEAERAKVKAGLGAREERYFDGYDRFDLERLLADERRRSERRYEDPALLRAAGDVYSRRALAEAVAGLPAAFAFLLVSLAQVLRRGNSIAMGAGAVSIVISIALAVTFEVVPPA
jgi:hypothetical protein